MARPRKIIYVDFKEKARLESLSIGVHKSLGVIVFFAVLVLLASLVAWFVPAWITGPFFGPTVILASVLAAVGAKRILIAWKVARLHKKMLETEEEESSDQRTLH